MVIRERRPTSHHGHQTLKPTLKPAVEKYEIALVHTRAEYLCILLDAPKRENLGEVLS